MLLPRTRVPAEHRTCRVAGLPILSEIPAGVKPGGEVWLVSPRLIFTRFLTDAGDGPSFAILGTTMRLIATATWRIDP